MWRPLRDIEHRVANVYEPTALASLCEEVRSHAPNDAVLDGKLAQSDAVGDEEVENIIVARLLGLLELFPIFSNSMVSRLS